jgi:hypothetical protein
MKTLKLFLLLLISVSAIAQENLYVGAGGTYGSGKADVDVIDKAGYYLTVGTNKTLTEKAGYFGEVQFIDERSGQFKNTSVNAAFAFRFLPVKSFSLNGGFNIGMYTSDNVNPELVDKNISKGKMHFITGLSYLTDRFEITGRYNHALSKDIFKGFFQIGFNYTLIRE